MQLAKRFSLLVLLFGASLFQTVVAMDETSTAELFISEHGTGRKEQALLLDTDISGEINGMVATITITQEFENTSTNWVDGTYVFPLPEKAAVDGLQLRIGDRVIQGVVKEKEQARKEFIQAANDGKRAGVLEQQRPNLFTMKIANIEPNSRIVAELRYIEPVIYRDGVFSLRIPTTLTPRYTPGTAVDLAMDAEQTMQASSSGWAVNKETVTHQMINPFSLTMNINMGLPIEKIESVSHALRLTKHSDVNTTISLTNDQESMDRDVLLTWRAEPSSVPEAAIFQQAFDGDYYSMIMLLPPQENIISVLPRNMVFIIDSSGSMGGESMRQAKAGLLTALDNLTQQDTFNIIDFDDDRHPLFDSSQPVTADNLALAKSFVSSLQADGGTEMYPALDFALQDIVDQDYLKQVIFITDGAIDNEAQLFQLIDEKLGDARLFTVGIGSAPNTFFMSKAASVGRGVFTYINDLSEVNEKMATLFAKLNRPLLRDIRVQWEEGSNPDVVPLNIPDLYMGEPLLIFAKTDKALTAVNIHGDLLEQPWTRELYHSGIENSDNLNVVWANHKIDGLLESLMTNELSEEHVKPLIIDLGVKHSIVSRFTSFIAIDDAPVNPNPAKNVDDVVPNVMPAGQALSIPQTATKAQLWMMLGGLLIVFGVMLMSRRPKRCVHA